MKHQGYWAVYVGWSLGRFLRICVADPVWVLEWPHIPVMAAIAVRKKVISIGHFSPCFRLQSLQIFYLLEEIKSDYMHWMHWKSVKNRTEPNELDELKYSKSLTLMTSYAHLHVFVIACSDTYQNISICERLWCMVQCRSYQCCWRCNSCCTSHQCNKTAVILRLSIKLQS